jgi:hypothetical protein
VKLRDLIVQRKHISYSCLATVLLVAVGAAPTYAQQKSVVTDWSSRHIKFTNPGSEMDALMNGHRQEWQSYVNNPRYKWQQLKRSAAWANRFANSGSAFSSWRDSHRERRGGENDSSLQGLWTSNVAPAGNGTAQGAFPAIYDANFASPSCTADYAVFPVNATGGATQPNLVVYNNLYVTPGVAGGTCSGNAPDVRAAYYVNTGSANEDVSTSPEISEDGTQVAFEATSFDESYFYVLTLPTSGTDGTLAGPTELTGTSGTTTHGTVYTVINLEHGDADNISSPYIDYTNNVAYVGDDHGYLHKINNVFGATAATEDKTAPWPFQPSGDSVVLTGPVVDLQTGDIFVGASNGELYCVTSAGASCGGSFIVSEAAGQTGGTAGAVYDAPIVIDNGNTSGTTGWAFAEAEYTVAVTIGSPKTTKAYSVLAQAPISSTGLGTATGVDVGTVSLSATGTITFNAPHLYSGDFDNEYYNSTAGAYTGNLYFCGTANASPAGATGTLTYNTVPELFRIEFMSAGTIVTTGTGSPAAVHTLASNNTATEASGCTPLTEFYNANANSGAGQDYLFLGVSGYGAPTDCDGDGCVMNFKLPSTSPTTLNPAAAYSLGGNGNGSSGIVIDNQSTGAGESQIYFGNLVKGDSTAASQAELQ